MKNYPEHQITTSAKAADSCVNEADSPMPELIRLTLYESAHNSDGLLLHGWDAAQPVIAFIRRRADHSKVAASGPCRG